MTDRQDRTNGSERRLERRSAPAYVCRAHIGGIIAVCWRVAVYRTSAGAVAVVFDERRRVRRTTDPNTAAHLLPLERLPDGGAAVPAAHVPDVVPRLPDDPAAWPAAYLEAGRAPVRGHERRGARERAPAPRERPTRRGARAVR